MLSIVARRTAAIGAASSMANGGRQSCRGSEMVFSLNKPSQGAIKNQPIKRGMKVVDMRGKKDNSASPWETNPMIVMITKTITSPNMRGVCLNMLRF